MAQTIKLTTLHIQQPVIGRLPVKASARVGPEAKMIDKLVDAILFIFKNSVSLAVSCRGLKQSG